MSEFEMKCEDLQTLPTGAKRDNAAGKGRFDLIPYSPMKRLAIVYEKGGLQKGDDNWKKGIPRTRLFSSALRHLFQALAGLTDEDHLAHCAWNIFALMYFEDMPIPSTGQGDMSKVYCAKGTMEEQATGKYIVPPLEKAK